MKKKDKELVRDKIENEGLDYCFQNYSSFPEIKDERFHQLREAYIKAAQELEDYLKD